MKFYTLTLRDGKRGCGHVKFWQCQNCGAIALADELKCWNCPCNRSTDWEKALGWEVRWDGVPILEGLASENLH